MKPPSESVGAIVRWRSDPSPDRVPPRAAVTNSRRNTLSLICQSVIPLLKLLDRSYRFRLDGNDKVKVNNSPFPHSPLPIIPVLPELISVLDAHIPKKPGFLPNLGVTTKFFRKKTGFLIPGA
jgi:hypothetical protein